MTRTDPVELTTELVDIASVNPELDDSEGEMRLADLVADRLTAIGADIVEQEVVSRRSNVIGTLPGTADGTVVLSAHLDTVPMPTSPMPIGVASGRLWGRGSCDTKASLGAMLVAMEELATFSGPRPTVVFAGSVDEEFQMKGARALAEILDGVDGIVVGEPTDLHVVRAHNGCVRFEIRVRGRTAHSSRATLGRNAIIDAGRLVTLLQDRLGTVLEQRTNPLTGAGLLTVTTVSGGVSPNVVPDLCTVGFDRRTVPGESLPQVLAEIDAALAEIAEETGVTLERVDPWLELPAMEVDADHPLVRSALEAVQEPVASGVPYCTDANVLTGGAGIPSIVLGPGSIDQAHAPQEWVEVDQVRSAVRAYVDVVMRSVRKGETL